MKIIINDREHEAEQGERLIDVARRGHAHIGYFCGGNAACQTCYVTVLEGAELLSAPGEPEKAMLSARLLEEGTRMACLATIEKPGTIRLLSAVEEVRRMAASDPLQLPAYSAKMGWEALVALPATIAMQIGRTIEGHFNPIAILQDMAGAVAGAIELAGHMLFGAGSDGKGCAEDCAREERGSRTKEDTRSAA
ncbi:2Fe-2S iron-sulfur cluster-binding protein [Chlorobium sp. N1]|uniref:2Fe-2S iron-sulfur cluster-binding protein n=1 Tax=Chlorobium sp. N1 TaxID=2491138 RepID=UPI00103E682C|nr:2Fe-2S iron-sulfur cluster-binding protein [Chlorobium sp. N1]TCD47360.1 (2Fe-2S)-binding protein [Chlorobium sp. N1]